MGYRSVCEKAARTALASATIEQALDAIRYFSTGNLASVTFARVAAEKWPENAELQALLKNQEELYASEEA